jgi:hypothetical protein
MLVNQYLITAMATPKPAALLPPTLFCPLTLKIDAFALVM